VVKRALTLFDHTTTFGAMLAEVAARFTQRISPEVYRGARAGLIPVDIALSLLAKRSFAGYRAWRTFTELTNRFFSSAASTHLVSSNDQQLLSALHDNGAAKGDDAYPRAELDEAREWVLALAARAQAKLHGQSLDPLKPPRWEQDGITHEFHPRTGNLRFYLTRDVPSRVPPLVSRFMDEPRLRAIAAAYFGTAHITSMAPYMMAEVLFPTLYPETWHLDCIRPTLKTFLYLDEVTANQGPLRVMPGTHRRSERQDEIFFRVCRGGPPAAYFTPEEDAQLDPLGTAITGRCGTLVVFDTRMLHAGSRCLEGRRVVLVNGYRPLTAARINPRLFRDPAPATLAWQRSIESSRAAG
jgi:hypothetical protein